MKDRDTTFPKVATVPVENKDWTCLVSWPRGRATVISGFNTSRGPSSRQMTSFILLFFHPHLHQLNLHTDHHNPNSCPLIRRIQFYPPSWLENSHFLKRMVTQSIEKDWNLWNNQPQAWPCIPLTPDQKDAETVERRWHRWVRVGSQWISDKPDGHTKTY